MMALTSIKVLCVDDNPIVGGAIRAKLERTGGFEWAGQLLSAEHLLDEALRSSPDVVLLDVHMPGPDPFTVLAELSALLPGVRVLMLSGHVNQALVDRAMEAGACGYFLKDDTIESMLGAMLDEAGGPFALGPYASAELLR